MVCPCCVSTPPCPPCAECDWPYKWPQLLFQQDEQLFVCNDPNQGGFSVVYQDIFPTFLFTSPNHVLPPGLSWKPGYPAALSACGDWVWVSDRSIAASCWECVDENGNPFSVGGNGVEKQKHRIFRIDCPDGPESVSVIDITTDALDGNTEPVVVYQAGPYANCVRNDDAYMPFFPTPEPVCNEFP